VCAWVSTYACAASGVAVLQGAHRLLLKTTNIKMGVRLGLLKQDHSRALVFEVDSAKMKGEKERYIAGQGTLRPTSVFVNALSAQVFAPDSSV
jgi:hypothetical protein